MNTISRGGLEYAYFNLPSSVGMVLPSLLAPGKNTFCAAPREDHLGGCAVVGPCMPVCRHGLQAKRVLTCGDHIQGDGVTIPAAMHVLGLKPCAQARIKDFRLALPEIWRQPALDPEVI